MHQLASKESIESYLMRELISHRLGEDSYKQGVLDAIDWLYHNYWIYCMDPEEAKDEALKEDWDTQF